MKTLCQHFREHTSSMYIPRACLGDADIVSECLMQAQPLHKVMDLNSLLDQAKRSLFDKDMEIYAFENAMRDAMQRMAQNPMTAASLPACKQLLQLTKWLQEQRRTRQDQAGQLAVRVQVCSGPACAFHSMGLRYVARTTSLGTLRCIACEMACQLHATAASHLHTHERTPTAMHSVAHCVICNVQELERVVAALPPQPLSIETRPAKASSPPPVSPRKRPRKGNPHRAAEDLAVYLEWAHAEEAAQGASKLPKRRQAAAGGAKKKVGAARRRRGAAAHGRGEL